MNNGQNGHLILKSLPTRKVHDQVAVYLKTTLEASAYEKALDEIKHLPAVLFENISQERGQEITADLTQMGAISQFRPFSSNDSEGQGKSDNKSPAPSEIHIPDKRNKIFRNVLMTVIFGLFIFSLFYFLSPSTQNPLQKNKSIHEAPTPETHQNTALEQNSGDKEETLSIQESSTTVINKSIENKKKIKVGVYIFNRKIAGLVDKPFADNLSDGLADNLKDSPNFKIVDRASMESIIEDNSLTAKQLFQPKHASQFGKKAGADIIIIGKLVSSKKISKKIPEESSVAIKAVDVASARLIDMGCFQSLNITDYRTWFNRMAVFVSNAVDSKSLLEQRTFVILKGLEDRSPEKSHFDRSKEILDFINKNFGNRPEICIVTQSHINDSLSAMNFEKNESASDISTSQTIYPMFLTIGGNISQQPESDTPFVLNLDSEYLGMPQQRTKINGISWNDGLKNLKETFDIILTAKGDAEHEKRLREANAQFKRGKEQSKLEIYERYWPRPPRLNLSLSSPGHGFSHSEIGAWQKNPDGNEQKISEERRIINLRDAIDSFESALFLNSDHHEAKLLLAACLHDSTVGDVQRAQNLLHEIISSTARDELRYIAAQALGIVEQIPYSPSFKKKLYSPDYYAKKYREELKILKGKNKPKWFDRSPAEVELILDAFEKSIYADCENMIWGTSQYTDSRGTLSMFTEIFTDLSWQLSIAKQDSNNQKMIAERYQKIIAHIRKHYPTAAPHFVADGPSTSSQLLYNELMLTISGIKSGVIKPRFPGVFYEQLSDLLRTCAASEKTDHSKRGISLAEHIDEYSSLGDSEMVYLAYCYYGSGEKDKAVYTLEKLGNRTITMFGGGPWGESTPISPYISFSPLKTKNKWLNIVEDEKPKRVAEAVFKLNGDRIIHAVSRDNDTIWMCTNKFVSRLSSIARYDPIVYQYKEGMKAPIAIKLPIESTNMATSIAAKKGTIWVGTDRGLLEFQSKKNEIRYYKEEDGLLKPNINSLCLVDNKLYIGLGSGVGYLDIETKHFNGIITTNDVVKITPSPTGIWALTKSSGILHFSNRTDKQDDKANLEYDNPYSLIANSRFLIMGKNLQHRRTYGMRDAGNGGIVIYDLELKKEWVVPGKTYLCGEDALSLAFDSKKLWIGGRGFLAVMDVSRKKVLHKRCFKTGEFHTLLPDNRGGMWVSIGSNYYHFKHTEDGFFNMN